MGHRVYRVFPYVLLCIVLITGCASTPVADSDALGPRTRIAVLEFRDESRYTYGKQRQDTSAERAMEQALGQRNSVLLIKREVWKLRVDENEIPANTQDDVIARAVLIGQTVDAEVVIVGTITRFTVNSDTTPSPSGGTRSEYSATAYLRAQVIDVASSAILFEKTASGSATGKGMTFGVIREKHLLDDALKKATSALARKIVKQL